MKRVLRWLWESRPMTVRKHRAVLANETQGLEITNDRLFEDIGKALVDAESDAKEIDKLIGQRDSLLAGLCQHKNQIKLHRQMEKRCHDALVYALLHFSADTSASMFVWHVTDAEARRAGQISSISQERIEEIAATKFVVCLARVGEAQPVEPSDPSR